MIKVKFTSREQHRKDFRCQKVSGDERGEDGKGCACNAYMLGTLVTLGVGMGVGAIEREHIDLVKGNDIRNANCDDEKIGEIHV